MDIVTVPLFNFHNELMWRLESKDGQIPEIEEIPLYCSAYRYTFDQDDPRVECWVHPLSIGSDLLELPLFIRSEIAVPVRLEQTYTETCQKLRINI